MSKTEHSKTEQKACLSTSSSSFFSPNCPSSRLLSLYHNPTIAAKHRRPNTTATTTADDDDEAASRPPLQRRAKSAPSTKHDGGPVSPRRPDYTLALCFVLLYLELAWLILMLLRSYHSRY